MKHRMMIGIAAVFALVISVIFLSRQNSAEPNSKPVPIIEEPAANVTVRTDIQYQKTEEDNCYLDIAYRDDGKAKPLLIFVHGGSWMSGEKEEMNSFLYTFSTRGYTVASINYDLLNLKDALQGKGESITDEESCVAAAAEYLVMHAEEYQIDTGRVVLIGHSAGGQLVGHLAEQIGNRPEDYAFRIGGIILLAAPSDLRYYLYNNIKMDGLDFSFVELSFIFDGIYGTDVIPEINKVDILYNINENLPPVLILHGSDDTIVPVSMSQNLYDTLKASGVTAKLTVIPGASHSILDNETVFSEINHFLEYYISGDKGE